MINVIKKEIDMEESLKKRLQIIGDFCNTTPTIINGSIRKIDRTNLNFIDKSKRMQEFFNLFPLLKGGFKKYYLLVLIKKKV